MLFVLVAAGCGGIEEDYETGAWSESHQQGSETDIAPVGSANKALAQNPNYTDPCPGSMVLCKSSDGNCNGCMTMQDCWSCMWTHRVQATPTSVDQTLRPPE